MAKFIVVVRGGTVEEIVVPKDCGHFFLIQDHDGSQIGEGVGLSLAEVSIDQTRIKDVFRHAVDKGVL